MIHRSPILNLFPYLSLPLSPSLSLPSWAFIVMLCCIFGWCSVD